MSDKMRKQQDDMDEMLPEYDFSGGMRGKHSRTFQRGYKVTIQRADGSTEERDCELLEGTVILDPDVREYFQDAESVNKALRGLIKLIPQ